MLRQSAKVVKQADSETEQHTEMQPFQRAPTEYRGQAGKIRGVNPILQGFATARDGLIMKSRNCTGMRENLGMQHPELSRFVSRVKNNWPWDFSMDLTDTPARASF